MADTKRTVENVLIGAPNVEVGGGCLIAPAVTSDASIPAATATISGVFSAGFITQDGATKKIDNSETDIKDWNGDTVLTVSESKKITFEVEFMEYGNVELLKAVFGNDNVADSNGTITITDNAKEAPAKMFVFELVGNENKKIRIVVPNGKVSTINDQKFVKGQAVTIPVTITANPTAEGTMVKTYIMPKTAVTSS